ncbi:hypothetical protein AB0N65_07250 [Paenarthrobacter sp. NPDC089322]|uniref:hypothetical protein n=1 Tax=Paenarthrobacter sp. NPDC089322 TaxID=3155065 RepID=UPI003444D6F5
MIRRNRRPGALTRRPLAALRHNRTPEHLQECLECRMALNRERQYLERLRGAAVPEASQDLTARLLQHTQRLANQPDIVPLQPRSQSVGWRSLRMVGAAAGTLILSAGALAVAAYAVAGDPAAQTRVTASADAAALAGSLAGGRAEPVAAPDFRPGSPATLTSAQLEALRDQGWACPELAGLGFEVVSAHATVVNGHPAVELRLESNGHYATVVEEHLDPSGPSGEASASAQLSVTQGTPWEAVYRTSAAVLTYASDLPAEKADDAVPELVRAGDSMNGQAEVQDTETWSERLLRGLRMLLRPAGL